MKVTLPDGPPLELPDGATGADAAAAIGPGLARAALAVKQDGEVRDLARPLIPDEPLEIITDRSGQDALDLIQADEHFEREDVPVADALERFRSEGQDYKVELIEDLVRDQGVETVSLYTNGPFTDLCRGPHAPTTKRIGAFKLQSVAGAYWRGDASRQMLTRVYGTAFFKPTELEEYLRMLEEARARDHRKLGAELKLFQFSDPSPGSPFWQPNGMAIWNELTTLWRQENTRRDYREVKTPILYDVELWKQSGHWGVYRDNMYFTDVEERAMGLKPMNCPAHVQIYKRDLHSYRDLPIRYSEQGLVHRHEPSGTLH